MRVHPHARAWPDEVGDMELTEIDPSQFPLLAALQPEDVEALRPLLEARKLARGRWVCREGAEADGLLLLRSGKVEVSADRSQSTAVLEAGAALGGLSLVDVGPRELAARTLEACELWALPRSQWHRLVEDHPRTACRLLEAIVQQLATSLREALDGFQDGTRERARTSPSDGRSGEPLH